MVFLHFPLLRLSPSAAGPDAHFAAGLSRSYGTLQAATFVTVAAPRLPPMLKQIARHSSFAS
ncbi:hypothetical protein RE6C_03186 [Rhodopirellula europaea 6C]|uniref:Uncharacterized protein n=1 Tax=Rhodopirellula europaea 6C TaxID=1263867 RepID=M2B2U0_9BACT|nr:hypothetical protein RE6C_03186 [Rhodopirellula europaea 6C]